MSKRKILIIGAGISGLAAARMLSKNYAVTVVEREAVPGGLIKCEERRGYLYHKVGGHVFNSKNKKVLDWFWSFFDKETEFLPTTRNARILWENNTIGYPVEDYVYQMNENLVSKIIEDWLKLSVLPEKNPLSYEHFEGFLKDRFGDTLYRLYFEPYNKKIWQTDLHQVPMAWLEGKLPMPDIRKMFLHNFLHQEEREMVHSHFYYPRKGGSQFIVDRLSEGIGIHTGTSMTSIQYKDNQWQTTNGAFDAVIYTGDIRRIEDMSNFPIQSSLKKAISQLKSNGTSNMLCETDATGLSWLYIPEPDLKAHRIIYTGNFSAQNNPPNGRLSCVVEFSGKTEVETMKQEIKKLPGNLKYISHNYEANSYIIHGSDTKQLIEDVKVSLQPLRFYLLGRFAEWEYYNMDKCIEAAMRLEEEIKKDLN